MEQTLKNTRVDCIILDFTSHFLEKTSNIYSFSQLVSWVFLCISRRAHRSPDGPLIFTSVTVWSPWVRKKIVHLSRIDNSWCRLSLRCQSPPWVGNERFWLFRRGVFLCISRRAHRSPDGPLIFTSVTVWSPWVRKKIIHNAWIDNSCCILSKRLPEPTLSEEWAVLAVPQLYNLV